MLLMMMRFFFSLNFFRLLKIALNVRISIWQKNKFEYVLYAKNYAFLEFIIIFNIHIKAIKDIHIIFDKQEKDDLRFSFSQKVMILKNKQINFSTQKFIT